MCDVAAAPRGRGHARHYRSAPPRCPVSPAFRLGASDRAAAERFDAPFREYREFSFPVTTFCLPDIHIADTPPAEPPRRFRHAAARALGARKGARVTERRVRVC
jgi:hypothetical protein